MKLERDLMKQIQQYLSLWQSTGDVYWWSRLQSGKVRSGQYFIKMCDKGTPDFIALLNTYNGLMCLFIEAKSDTGQLRPEQKSFALKYNNECIKTLCIRDIKDLESFVYGNARDFVKDIGV